MPGPDEATGFPGVPASGKLAFAVFRNNAPLGRHALSFRRDGDRLEVEIEVEYVLKLGFLTLYRYALTGREVFVAGRLEAATFRADDNGKGAHLNVSRAENGLLIEGSAGQPFRAPTDWRLATHWSRRQLGAPMISPQDGAVLRYGVSESDAPGGQRRYRLAGAQPLELWYDASEVWVGLRAPVFDGSRVEYRRTA